MKGDIPAPALRLLAQSTVRTHLAPDRSPRPSGYVDGAGKGGRQANVRAIKIGATVYPSIKAAIREHRVSFDMLKRWIRNGEAEYL